MTDENIHLIEDIPNKNITDEEKTKLKNQIKEQYKNMIKLIDSIGNIDKINDQTATVDLDELTHFDINKIYCNCCGFTSVEQNIRKTTFYILTFTFNIVMMFELTLLLILTAKNRYKNNGYEISDSSSFSDVLSVD